VIYFVLLLFASITTYWIWILDRWPSYPVSFDIADYGGFPGMDITDILQECTDEILESGAGAVYIKAGTYVMSEDMVVLLS
jgi:hypothetical protein